MNDLTKTDLNEIYRCLKYMTKGGTTPYSCHTIDLVKKVRTMIEGYDHHKWISVEDRLPSYLRKVLFHWICSGGNKNVSMGYLCQDGWDIYLPYVSYKLHNERVTVTHWMELSEYPKCST